MNKKIITLVAAAGASAACLEAAAQMTFRCTGNDGKRYYGSTIPQQCLGRPVEQLNAQGLVVKRIDHEAAERNRLAKAAEDKKRREEEAAAREKQRRNNALLATYTSEKDIEDARARALADNEKAVKEVEVRIAELKKKQDGYNKEMEFYAGNKTRPAQLDQDIRNVEIDIKAQEDLLAAKKKSADVINAKYDGDKKRYRELTSRR
jgi:hypothetical protein